MSAVEVETFLLYDSVKRSRTKHFQFPLEGKGARKIQKIERKLFTLPAEFRRAKTLGLSFEVFERLSLKKAGTSFSN
jgi:hypothetical protein